MELKPGYKQTEVGVIPEDWEVKSLGQIMEYIKGFPFKADDYQSHGIRVLRVSDTTYDGIREGGGIYIDEKKAKSCLKWSLKEGDLIVSTVGSKPPMYSSMVGKVTFIQARDSGSLLNQNAVILRGRSSSIAIQRVLHNHFRQGRYLKYIEKIFRGNANQASITLRELLEYRIPFTPFGAEQEAIAEALSDADALIESLEQLIAKKRHIKQGAMQELLTGKNRLPGFSGEWEVKRVAEFGEIITGGTPNTQVNVFWGEGYPWITPTDISRYCDMYTSERTITQKGLNAIRVLPSNTVLVTCIASIGKNAILKVVGGCNQQINAIVPNTSFSADFLYYLFEVNKQYLIANSGTTATSIISKKTFEELIFKVPFIYEQNDIALFLSDMDNEITVLEEKLEKAHHLKQGMMQNLLSGKIRLV